MRIDWETQTLGPMFISLPDDKVMEYVNALNILGLNPEVSIDTDSEGE